MNTLICIPSSHQWHNPSIQPSFHPSVHPSLKIISTATCMEFDGTETYTWRCQPRHTDRQLRTPPTLPPPQQRQLWIESSTSTFTSIAGRGATSKAASQPATGAVAWSKGSQSFGRQNMWSSINGIADRIPLNDWTENGNVVFGKMWWISIPSRKQIIPFILFYANIKGSHNLIPRTQKLSFGNLFRCLAPMRWDGIGPDPFIAPPKRFRN